MKRRIRLAAILCLLVLPASASDILIWKQFVETLKTGKMTIALISPYEGISGKFLLDQLLRFRHWADSASSWGEWETTPEIFRVEDQVHFILPLGFGGESRSEFCFTFLISDGKWAYRHLENIFMRLDRTPPPPTSDFPDSPSEQKAWQREEIYWSHIVHLHSVLVPEKGEEFFLNLLKDGAGYFLAAKTWVPFVQQQKAFILYLCWEQSRLRENLVTLERLTEDEALVRMQTHFFFLYKRAYHLKQQIPAEDYRRIFEAIWQDRAKNAGWDLEISYEDPECLQTVLHFKRSVLKRNGEQDPAASA